MTGQQKVGKEAEAQSDDQLSLTEGLATPTFRMNFNQDLFPVEPVYPNASTAPALLRSRMYLPFGIAALAAVSSQKPIPLPERFGLRPHGLGPRR